MTITYHDLHVYTSFSNVSTITSIKHDAIQCKVKMHINSIDGQSLFGTDL